MLRFVVDNVALGHVFWICCEQCGTEACFLDLWWTKWNWGMFSGFVVDKVELGHVFWICGEQSGTGECFLNLW
jgi:hypothetical protein